MFRATEEGDELDFDERTALGQCRRELECAVAAMERCLVTEEGDEDMVVEHFHDVVSRVAEKLSAIERGGDA